MRDDVFTWGAALVADGPDAPVGRVPRQLPGPEMLVGPCIGSGTMLGIAVPDATAAAAAGATEAVEQQTDQAASLLPQQLLYNGYVP